MTQTTCTHYIYQPVSVNMYCAMEEPFVYLTLDPDDTQIHTVCLYHLTEVCWNASATLPTQLEYSRNETTKKGSGLCTASICHWIVRSRNTKKTWVCLHTEHSSSEVWTQPERSFRTQQAELRSIALFSLIRSCTCLSCRMHGEYLAPKWIRASCRWIKGQQQQNKIKNIVFI